MGSNVTIGNYNVFEGNVTIGNNTQICNFVLLKDGTVIGDNCYIDSYTLTSGNCIIGNNCKIRYRSVIARNVIIEDNVFFSAGVKTIYLNQSATPTNDKLIIESGCFLGDNCVVMGGVRIAKNCIIGACALVLKDTEPNGVYVGSPAKRIRDIKEGEIWHKK